MSSNKVSNRFWSSVTKASLVTAMAVMGGISAQAAEPSKAMLVLDASGSMWGQINGKPKIEIARDTIKNIMSTWDQKIHLGLSAYGHRRKGDCNDIQTLHPVGPANREQIINSVNSLKPKGKTPLSDAVRAAAQELKYTEGKATVILVSDGKETCEANPCEVGKALENLGIDFTVHVVGFDIKGNESKGLQCLAKNTGGLYLPAKDAGQLKKALQTVVKKVKVEPKPVVKKTAALKPGQHFQAVLKEGGLPLRRGMRWDIYHAAKDINGKRKHVNGNYNPTPRFKLKAGKYLVVAKYGNAIASSEFDVQSISEAKKHTVVLNAGSILFKAALDVESANIKNHIRWDIYKDKKIDLQNKRVHINGNYNATPVFHVNAGKYHVVVKRGNAVKSATFEIAPGDRKEQQLILNAGLAFFNATFSEGGKEIAKGMRWDVYSAKKNLEGKRKHFNGNYLSKPWFTLPVGKYHVVAKRGNAILSKKIEIKAGERTDTTFNMNAGLLAMSAVLTDGNDAEKKGMRWDVYTAEKNADGKRRHLNGNYNSKPNFTLTAGRYYVVAKNGNSFVDGEVEIKAGERNDKIFNLDAGRVKLHAIDKSENQLKKGLRWDIYTAKDGKADKHINGNYSVAPIFTLDVGSYIVQIKVGNIVKQHKLDITAGMSEQVDIPVE